MAVDFSTKVITANNPRFNDDKWGKNGCLKKQIDGHMSTHRTRERLKRFAKHCSAQSNKNREHL